MPTQKFTNEIITAAIEGFEAQKRRIDEQIGELRAMLSGRSAEPAAAPSVQPKPRRKRRLSAAGRKAISEASKKRWAAAKAAKQTTEKPMAAKKTPRKKATPRAAAKQAPVRMAKKIAPVKKAVPKKAAKAPEQAATATE